ncbi:MAG: hypothetical protein COB46_09945 [Rhodospirillaceae bacterium]|nr:MAG: hypothetical protein COB46_09945 [Rhodospirillaceae bacterium]
MKALIHQFKFLGQILKKHGLSLLLAVLLPFICSHLVVLLARQIGMPYRLGLDFIHGVFVLAYLAAVVRLKFSGMAKFGFAMPRLACPGLKPLFLAAVSVVLIGLPVALALHPLTQALEALADERGGLWAFVPTIMVPEFTMTTLVGLALAAALGKVKS